MKILFLTLAKIDNIRDSGIYQDLLRKFIDNNHEIIIISPTERKYNQKTHISTENRLKILKVWTTNFQKTNLIEKSLTTIFIEIYFFIAIKKYISLKNIDLILYTTPPITLTHLINNLKKTTKAKTYLLLKDIFPQNAVDLKLMKENSFIHRYFRKKEIILYQLSDFIGCMSPENMNYLLKNNKIITSEKVEVNPNSIEVDYAFFGNVKNEEIFYKYQIPDNKVLFLFGGNLGLPQGIENLKKNILNCSSLTDAFFIIVGNGTEYPKLKKWFSDNNIKNACLIRELPKKEYIHILNIANVGLIFLNPLFTIPNFPSRILSYMQQKIPVICATDNSTDIGVIAEKNNFGFHCEASNTNLFFDLVKKLLDHELRLIMGQNAYNFLVNEYSVDISYTKIINKLSH
jgi:glycosyltransferase involved in cell wall biosynthesis